MSTTNNHAVKQIDAAINAELGITAAHTKAANAHRAAAAALHEIYAPADADEATACMSEERAWHKDRLAKKLKDAKAAKAFANAFDQIRVFWIVLAEPEHGVVVTKGGAAVPAGTLIGNVANARHAAKAIIDGDDGSKRAAAPRGARAPAPKAASPSDPVKVGQKAFEGDMVAARAAFESILAMQSGWGMVIDVLRAHGFRVEKIEAAAPMPEAPKAEAPKTEAPKTEAPKAKAKGKAKAEGKAA
jgi:hypothetical protein